MGWGAQTVCSKVCVKWQGVIITVRLWVVTNDVVLYCTYVECQVSTLHLLNELHATQIRMNARDPESHTTSACHVKFKLDVLTQKYYIYCVLNCKRMIFKFDLRVFVRYCMFH